MAISVNMLEFVCDLFVHGAPNERAWADALTIFLSRRDYIFSSEVSRIF
jgi:hypothetical protein